MGSKSTNNTAADLNSGICIRCTFTDTEVEKAFSVIFYTQFTWKNLAYTNIKYQHFFGRSGLRVRLLVWSSCTNHTWLTDHPCIFCVTTVMDTNTIVRAVNEDCLIPCTVHILQKDWSNSTVKNVAGNSNRYCICNQNETLSQN